MPFESGPHGFRPGRDRDLQPGRPRGRGGLSFGPDSLGPPRPWNWRRGASTPQIRRVFDNLAAVAEAAGGGLGDIVKLTVYLTDLDHFPRVNEIMAEYFREPYPARAAIGVAALPRAAAVEMDAILVV